MGKKNLIALLSGSKDQNIRFETLRTILLNFGFKERVKGSHHIFSKHGVEEIINIQSKKKMAKPYQVKQVRNVILKYKLFEND